MVFIVFNDLNYFNDYLCPLCVYDRVTNKIIFQLTVNDSKLSFLKYNCNYYDKTRKIENMNM